MSETVFTQVNFNLKALIEFIDLGQLGLPDIQRPFVWKNVKVRDLFDSMYKGYPVGYLLFWENAQAEKIRAIGTGQKQTIPNLLIVDGQQRLTSLYAVFKSILIKRENYSEELIQIGFNPLEEKFDVADATVQKNKEYIPNISVLWSKDVDLFSLVGDYLDNLKASREVTVEQEQRIKKAITRLSNLQNYPFTALTLAASNNEEQVSDVFVRINSKGTPLNQADFILTLMSVFWDEGRHQIEHFCHDSRVPSASGPSSFNYFIKPSPDQMLRVSIGLGFKRARLKYVYSILRGKDLDTEEFSNERRVQQFEILKESQANAMNIQYWQDFFKSIRQAGFRSSKMISSNNNLLFSYIFYLMGRTQFGVEEFLLRKTIARWFFMVNISSRYTSSPETALEADLAKFREVKEAGSFVEILDRICEENLTNDFWNIKLPNDLATSSASSPSLYAYHAALNLIDAHALFSKGKVADLLDPNANAHRSAIERHHLFPKGYLKTLGIMETRDTNQIANYALVEWGDNAAISDMCPEEYLPKYLDRFSEIEIKQMYYWHAMPSQWESMNYSDFLTERRKMIARVIRDGYFRLVAGEEIATETAKTICIKSILNGNESKSIEFKSTLRMNLHTKESDPKMEHAVMKSIAAFLNSQGGVLLVGVDDSKQVLGVDIDNFLNEDKMGLHLDNLINTRLGKKHHLHVTPSFFEYNGKIVLAVDCKPAKSPAYLKDGNSEKFYIRAGLSTEELSPSQMQDYISQRFKQLSL